MEAMFSCGRVAFAIITILCCFTSPAIACPLPERNLLLDFKAAVVDEYNTLTSWHGFNSCTWRGVSCNLGTGHVSRLDLSGFNLEVTTSSREFYVSLESLSNLVSLENLSLARMNISVNKEWGEVVGSLSNLQELSMSDCGLGGQIPNSLLKLTSLLHLDLSYNYLSAHIPAWFENVTGRLLSLDLSWNENFGGDISFIGQRKSSLSLTRIVLSGTAIKGRIPSAIWNISCLEHLRLSDTRIEGEIPASIGNLSSLQSLDLSDTRIEGGIPSAIGNALSLESLHLSYTGIEGEIPSAIGNVSSLKSLYLSDISIESEFPVFILNLSKLVELDLSYNMLTGVIPPSLDSLSSLVSLDLNANELNGTIPSTISNLVNLRSLSLHSNSLSGLISLSFKLSALALGSCNLDRIPSFLVTQYDLEYLDLSANSGLPLLPARVALLDLSMNQFNGSIPSHIDAYLENSRFLSFSRNNLSGAIPDSICTPYLQVLDISKNTLSSVIPPHLTRNCSSLSVLDLAENHLEGKLPAEWGNITKIHTLKLNGNHLRGVIPSSISEGRSLQVLDLGNNDLEGTLPHWIGSLSHLHVLVLRSNHFHGSIPRQVIGLPNLQILDLSGNHLSGAIPSNLTNLLAMVNASQNNSNHLEEYSSSGATYTNQIKISWKGWDVEFVKVLFILKCIDLSNNFLSGSIPPKMGSLQGLIALKLSRNHLSGRIPKTLGLMDQLESLDLSLNRLNGNIPLEFELLSYLQFLNLSYNMLDGKSQIPSAIWNISCLEHLRLRDTRIEGEIPFAVWNMSPLKDLLLSNTRIEGEIPSAIGNALSLESLSLSNTRFEENNSFKDDWVIDSEATQHMSHNKERFELISESSTEKIYLRSISALEVKGTGNVKVDNGVLKNVKLVPQLKTNLLSVSQIANQGYKIEFYNDKCLIKDMNDNYRVTAIGKMENGLYNFQEFTSNNRDENVCAIAQCDDMSGLWHE
ncbi:receptor-like protein 19 [Cryptomeria japonica]|uniref:receptor-like protein 19 n=1 Tax=Cryptomeria japonica TaxID=3369 RepID=UPI0027DA7881|nr:receptor-like protein 19 [Cryptomeria japonica]